MLRWLSVSCLFAAATGLLADDEKKAEVTAQATGLNIRKPLPPKKKDAFMFAPSGTTLEVTLSAPNKFILGIDAKASKLERLVDDKDTKLNAGSGTFAASMWLSDFAQITPDGERCTVQMSGQAAPAAGASKVLAKGTVVLKCGSGEKTTEKKKITIKKDAETKIGAYIAKVAGEGSAFVGPGIVILSNARDVKSVEFFDAKGTAISIIGAPYRNDVFKGPGKTQYAITYTLPKKLDALAVKVTFFSKVESVEAPFDLSVGVGLD